jgi:hypothetical protein
VEVGVQYSIGKINRAVKWMGRKLEDKWLITKIQLFVRRKITADKRATAMMQLASLITYTHQCYFLILKFNIQEKVRKQAEIDAVSRIALSCNDKLKVVMERRARYVAILARM